MEVAIFQVGGNSLAVMSKTKRIIGEDSDTDFLPKIDLVLKVGEKKSFEEEIEPEIRQ